MWFKGACESAVKRKGFIDPPPPRPTHPVGDLIGQTNSKVQRSTNAEVQRNIFDLSLSGIWTHDLRIRSPSL